MSLTKAQKAQALKQVKKVGEINFLLLPDGKIAVPMILSPDVKLATVISGIHDIQERMIAAYEALGDESTGSDYVRHESSKQASADSKHTVN